MQEEADNIGLAVGPFVEISHLEIDIFCLGCRKPCPCDSYSKSNFIIIVKECLILNKEKSETSNKKLHFFQLVNISKGQEGVKLHWRKWSKSNLELHWNFPE